MNDFRVRRLGRSDLPVAREMFAMMAGVFEENIQDAASKSPTHDYLDALLRRDLFWAFAAFANSEIIGGLTAHTLPRTRSACAEVFIYDLAVRRDYRRQGVGSRLMQELRASAAAPGIAEVFVAAENDDSHALDFYRARGGVAAAVTFFTFPAPSTPPQRGVPGAGGSTGS